MSFANTTDLTLFRLRGRELGAFALVASLDDADAARMFDHMARNQGLPTGFDRPALATARDMLGRKLESRERSAFREMIRAALRARDGKRKT